MTTAKALLRLTPLALGLAVCIPAIAETPQQVQQRLDQYRQQDEAAAKRRAEQQLEAAQRRERTRQRQEQRRREEYARRWKCYGAREIDDLLWRQQKDGTWVTSAKLATGAIPCVPDKPPEGDLGTRPRLPSASAGLAWPEQPRFGSCGTCTGPTFSADQLIGVNCTSLMVNRKLPYEGWERWVRPGKGSPDEQLVIDRCTTSKP